METPVCKCCCRHPALEIACPAWRSSATIIKSDFGWGSRQGHLLCNSASTWGLAQILFPRSWRWHVHGVPSLASAWALLTKHLGHGFSSGFGVQDWVSFLHQSYLDLKMQAPSLGTSNHFHEIHLTKAPIQYLWSPGIINHEIKFSLCSVQIKYTWVTLADWHLPCSSSRQPLLYSLFLETAVGFRNYQYGIPRAHTDDFPPIYSAFPTGIWSTCPWSKVNSHLRPQGLESQL